MIISFYKDRYLEIPKDLFQEVLEFVDVADIKNVSTLNKGIHTQANEALVRHARQFNYPARDLIGSKAHLNILFTGMQSLVRRGCIPEKYITFYGKTPDVSSEATVRNLKRAIADEKIAQASLPKIIHKSGCEEDVDLSSTGSTSIVKIVNESLKQCLQGPSELKVNLINELTAILYIDSDGVKKPDFSGIMDVLVRGLYDTCVKTKDVVALLLKAGADPNALVENYKGNRPLHVAALCGSSDVLSLLLEYKADVNQCDNKGRTPLHCATDKDSAFLDFPADIIEKNVQILLDAGAQESLPQSHRRR